MKNNLLKFIALGLVCVLLCLVNMPASSKINSSNIDVTESSKKVITVADINDSEFNANEVYKARFLNMLNHNYVYNDSFKSVEDMVNDSMPALIGYRENEDDSFIAEQFVTDYIFNMYGIDFIDYSAVNAEFEQVEGKVYILPRGFAVYKHEITSVKLNEDGSFTVYTKVEISSHDSGTYFDECETLFVKNELSQFGFSIIHSNIGAQTVSV